MYDKLFYYIYIRIVCFKIIIKFVYGMFLLLNIMIGNKFFLLYFGYYDVILI